MADESPEGYYQEKSHHMHRRDSSPEPLITHKFGLKDIGHVEQDSGDALKVVLRIGSIRVLTKQYTVYVREFEWRTGDLFVSVEKAKSDEIAQALLSD